MKTQKLPTTQSEEEDNKTDLEPETLAEDQEENDYGDNNTENDASDEEEHASDIALLKRTIPGSRQRRKR